MKVKSIPKYSRSPKKLLYQHVDHYYYHPTHLLGEGFSSKVYKGTNSLSNQEVAIKVINTSMFEEPINVTLLQFEIETLKKINGSPNILTLHSITKKDEQTFIITEACQTDVSKMLKPSLGRQTVQKFSQQLFNGFYQLYRKQIIHRDLKPANLLIDKSGNLKIADFGFAINSCDARSQMKYNIGSPLYMAPQVLKRNQYTHKSDIWSIGIIIFEMLTGDTPWKAQNQQQLYQNYEELRIEEILQNQNFPQRINKILMRTLQFDRRFRISPDQLLTLFQQNKDNERTEDEQIRRSNIFIPKQGKGTKTERFHKALFLKSPLNKTEQQISEEVNSVMVKPLRRRNRNNTICDIVDTNQTIINKQEDDKQTNFTTQTVPSTLKILPNPDLTQLKKGQTRRQYHISVEESKSLTNKVVFYIHICRLLYKIMVRVNQCIQNSKNEAIIIHLETYRAKLFQAYSYIIVDYLYKVKNLTENNFINLALDIFDAYCSHTQFKKVKKAATQYIQRYSQSQELLPYWKSAKQPNFQDAIYFTSFIIVNLWPQLCQKNHGQIILLEFLLFAHSILNCLLTDDCLDNLKDKSKMEDYVDTIPNNPSLNRFKEAITKAKSVSSSFKIKENEESC